MPKHLFLDLEDTVITPAINGWACTDFINTEKIKNFIEHWRPDQVHIFSFAIWNQHELNKFNNHLRVPLEDNLGVRFTIVPTVDDNIIPACCKVKGIQLLEFHEMSAFWGKGGAFQLFVKNLVNRSFPIDMEVALIDDAVENEQFIWPDLHVIGQLINVDSRTELCK